jgi:hypothetical protein
LFVDGGDRIVDQDGNHVPIPQAKQLWESRQVAGCNLSFKRLATLAGWDFAELKRQYAEMDAARCK